MSMKLTRAEDKTLMNTRLESEYLTTLMLIKLFEYAT